MEGDFYTILKSKAHQYIMLAYDLTEKFPRSELFGSVSQLRRASLSIMLNFTEGFARLRPKVKLQFWETAYGSSKECQYLVFLARERKWISPGEYQKIFYLVEEISKMLWRVIEGLKNSINEVN